MPRSNFAMVARCPFYQCDKLTGGIRRIICEGLTEDSRLSFISRNGKAVLLQYNTFCADKFENCELYRAVMSAKYEE